MSKSIYAVAGIGLLACVALSMMMQHLLEVQNDDASSPLARELQEMCGDYLEGRVEVRHVEFDDLPTAWIRVRVKAGVDREKFARSASDLLWRAALRLEQQPTQMRFEVASPGGEPPVVVQTREPGMRLQRPARRSPREGATAPKQPAGARPAGGR